MDTTSRAFPVFCTVIWAGLFLAACATPESTTPDPNPARTYDPPVFRAPQYPAPTSTAAPSQTAPMQRTMAPDLRTRLRTVTLGKLVFTAETGEYREVAQVIQTLTGIPIIVTPSGREVIDTEGLLVILELVAPISLESMLNFMTSQSDDLTWVVREEVVMITSRADAGDQNVVEVYDVRDLTFAMTSFLPPEINKIPGESLDLALRPRTGGEEEDKIRRVEPDQLVNIIKDATDPDYWSGDTGASIDVLDTGYLVVNASREMHRRIAGFLGDGR